jgi:hypothetical protein
MWRRWLDIGKCGRERSSIVVKEPRKWNVKVEHASLQSCVLKDDANKLFHYCPSFLDGDGRRVAKQAFNAFHDPVSPIEGYFIRIEPANI